jgi:heme/copper-type cytochrome/quinol oxidase subunit 2
MNMNWLIVAGVVVMVLGLIATLMIGLSKSNKEENPVYFRHTGRKWIRLSGIYVVSLVIAAIIFIILLNK